MEGVLLKIIATQFNVEIFFFVFPEKKNNLKNAHIRLLKTFTT